MQPQLPIRKSKEQIEFYLKNGPKFGSIIGELYDDVTRGYIKTGLELEKRFFQLILGSFRSKISFIFSEQTNHTEERFSKKICVSINDIVAHCRPTNKVFKDGDIISADFGVRIGNLCFDAAWTAAFNIAQQPSWIYAPWRALKDITDHQPKNTHEIAQIIHSTAQYENLDVVVMLTGHGIGYSLHEPPRIRNAPGGYSNSGLFEGLCFCAEPIFSLKENDSNSSGIAKIYVDSDGWSIRTENGQPVSHFETMYCMTDNKLVDICGITEWF